MTVHCHELKSCPESSNCIGQSSSKQTVERSHMGCLCQGSCTAGSCCLDDGPIHNGSVGSAWCCPPSRVLLHTGLHQVDRRDVQAVCGAAMTDSAVSGYTGSRMDGACWLTTTCLDRFGLGWSRNRMRGRARVTCDYHVMSKPAGRIEKSGAGTIGLSLRSHLICRE